jgi:membrane dipeptidase
LIATNLQRALDILAHTPLIDGHNDLPWAMREQVQYDFAQFDLSARQHRTHTDLVRLREGRLGAQFWSVYVPSSLGDGAVAATLEQIDFVHQLVARFPKDLEIALRAADVERVFAAGRVACLLGAEGGHCIANSLGVLRMFYALGVRYLTLTHNENNAWADSATDEPSAGGLTPFGRDVVREMNRLAMLIDLAHVSPETMRDAMDTSQAPVIYSHSSCRALVDHPRNVPDPMLERLRDNGGVCMVAFVPQFVSEECRLWDERLGAHMRARGLDPDDWPARKDAQAELAASDPQPKATLEQVVDHIEHVRDVAGIDHVGIGSDFDGCDMLPVGLEDVSCFPNLIAALLDRGWNDQDCAKLAGGNVLRVMREAEGASQMKRPA